MRSSAFCIPKSSNREESKAVIDIEVSETVEVLFSAVTVISSIPPLFFSSSSSANTLKEKETARVNFIVAQIYQLEEQFKMLTNNFEEINFKLDKLSSRITKVQTDNQVRFQDLERSETNGEKNLKVKKPWIFND